MTAVVRTPGNALEDTEPIQLAGLLAALREQRRFRIEQLEELAAQIADRSRLIEDDPQDEVADVLRAGAASALREIEAALARIEVGSYGKCERCECAIPLERLEILPMAALCMQCQRALEARAR
jgi:RNA polymerase-binding transcription factor DksA